MCKGARALRAATVNNQNQGSYEKKFDHVDRSPALVSRSKSDAIWTGGISDLWNRKGRHRIGHPGRPGYRDANRHGSDTYCRKRTHRRLLAAKPAARALPDGSEEGRLLHVRAVRHRFTGRHGSDDRSRAEGRRGERIGPSGSVGGDGGNSQHRRRAGGQLSSRWWNCR